MFLTVKNKINIFNNVERKLFLLYLFLKRQLAIRRGFSLTTKNFFDRSSVVLLALVVAAEWPDNLVSELSSST